ncbi:MAG TPA: MotA/TolQ/ExbB proton channel family protein [Thermoanaerobaculia bacterium]
MKRLLLPVLIVALVASWLFWGLNLLYAVETLSGISILRLGEEDVPYMARVDLSTVTTLVVALTLFAVTRGVWSIRNAPGGEPWKLWHPGFPFSHGFRNLLIQLGLLGTIFAFIVAFDDMARSTKSTSADAPTYDPTILIAPLGTALWSTFAGIAVAFLVLPPLEALFKKAMGAGKVDDAHQGVEAVGSSIAELERRARDSAAALERLSRQVGSLEADLGREAFKKAAELGEGLRKALGQLDGAARDLKPALDSTREVLAAFPDPVRGATELVLSLKGELTLHRRAALHLSESLDRAHHLLSVFADPRRGVGAVVESLAGTGAGLQSLAEALRAAPDAPHWPALEGSPLGEEIGTLRSQLVRVEDRIETLVREVRTRRPSPPGRPYQGVLGTIRAWLSRWRKVV